jgi:hypothetical protein
VIVLGGYLYDLNVSLAPSAAGKRIVCPLFRSGISDGGITKYRAMKLVICRSGVATRAV